MSLATIFLSPLLLPTIGGIGTLATLMALSYVTNKVISQGVEHGSKYVENTIQSNATNQRNISDIPKSQDSKERTCYLDRSKASTTLKQNNKSISKPNTQKYRLIVLNGKSNKSRKNSLNRL